ncbi:MAG: redoxin domain-containing protein [Gemmatimonadetes bacterium]|nr:redoxin domain-containing protein [Gemmatimonadota bacterium]MYH54163.1 redoxin domain-containing protein [Gemmatimonadota bacterium]MYK67018.1 redoxin domain-containing protein [Gemmatimonadota bacterium]
MKKRSRRSPQRAGLLLVGILLVLGACESGGPPTGYTPEELAAAKAELRDHRRLRTYEAGKLLGDEWVARAPHDSELRALYAYQLVGWGFSKEVHEQADAILADDPDDPWGLYTRAYAHFADRDAELAFETVRDAWEASPQPEFAFLYLRALVRVDFEAAREFLASLDDEARGWPEVLRMEAEIEDVARYELEDPSWADSMRATWAEYKERFPDHVLGYTRLANEAYNDRRMDDWTSLMEAALELAPGSAEVRGQHWRGLWMSELLPREERRPAIEASMAAYRKASPETVEGLQSMATLYRQMEDEERAAELDAQIVALDPASYHASSVYLTRMRATRDKLYELYEEHGEDSPEYHAQLVVVRDAVHEYLAKPLYNNTYKGGAYLNLFSALRAMDPVPAEELAEAIRGMAEHERLNPHITFGDAPLAMIEHTPYALEAADIARAGALHVYENMKEMRSFYDTEGEFDQSLRYRLSSIYDVIGWAHFKAGHTEDARHTLERALALAEGNRDVRYHLGQVYEQLAAEEEKGDAKAATEWLDRAEDSYIAGFGASRGENPNETALEALYERRNGSREGIEEYLATLDERDRTRRHERIMESRVEDAETYRAFELARLDGEIVNSADLEGKIAVLHFWGTWCGPCIVELPEYQEFDERYREDPDVHVLSISNDETNEIIEDFLAKNNYDFTVLIDAGYTERAGVTAWPTTWFVDRDGYVRFEAIGTALKLDEEFSWRVEALRGDPGSHSGGDNP